MLTESQRSLLKFKSLLGLLTDEANWDELEKSLVIKHAVIGEVIVHEGMASSDCYIPLDGEVELFSYRQAHTAYFRWKRFSHD
ncbi:MAG: hypothetical protein EOP05_16440 [Proteobacteria bacterium]|nr:MAG: hypothetical protein EOP05_16440 [Pseudomonadota bacterium]